MEHIETLEKDVVLALALASGTSVADAAERAGVGRTTAYRKLDNPAFHRQVCEFRDKLISTALGRMADKMSQAADALVLMCEAPEPHIRIRAIRTLFSLGIRLRDSIDVTGRMRAVDAELARQLGGA